MEEKIKKNECKYGCRYINGNCIYCNRKYNEKDIENARCFCPSDKPFTCNNCWNNLNLRCKKAIKKAREDEKAKLSKTLHHYEEERDKWKNAVLDFLDEDNNFDYFDLQKLKEDVK